MFNILESCRYILYELGMEELIKAKLEYDKEEYNEFTYTREYRHKKLLKFAPMYKKISMGYLGLFDHDIQIGNRSGKYQYGLLYEALPTEFDLLIDAISEYQTVHLNIIYPVIMKEICLEQDLFFLFHAKHSASDDLGIFDNIRLIIPLCYIMCFGSNSSQNRLQVLFYQRTYSYADDIDQTTRRRSFFIDDIPLEDLKNSKNRENVIFNYIMDLQSNLFEEVDVNEFYGRLFDFKTCFQRITTRGV